MARGRVVGTRAVGAAVIRVTSGSVVVIDDRSAVGDVGVVVVEHPMAAPVASPVAPTPPKSSEETDPEADSESNPYSAQEDARHGIPAWIRDDRRAVHKPGIIGRDVDRLRIGGFDDDGLALIRYLLLFSAIQVAGLLSLLTQCLDGIRHFLLVIGVCVTKRGSPREVFVHVFKDRGELCEGLHARVPRLFVDFLCQLFSLQLGMALHPAIRLDNLVRIR